MKSTSIFFSYLLFAIFLFFGKTLSAQSDTLYYLFSDFETTEDQARWSSLPDDNPNIKWVYDQGSIGIRPPISAASGTWNAVFRYPDAVLVYSRSLVSPKIDLSVSQKPQLVFDHSQYSTFTQDYMYLLFRAGATAPWDTIDKWLTAVNNWQKEVYNIDEIGSKYLCKDFQLAFLAFSTPEGNGVCVDKVFIEEKDTIAKYVSNLEYFQVQHKMVNSNADQVPLVKVKVDILGNDGPIDLKNIAFTLDAGNASYFKANGFRLFHTTGNVFQNKIGAVSTQVGAAVSISGTTITFSGLSRKLALGANYLWLTADFTENVPHNSLIEFGVNANSLRVNDTLLPSARINSIYSDYIEEAVFFDNFETIKGWNISSWGGDFEIGIPQGKSLGSTRDPNYTYSGTNVLGTDLSANGLYLPNIPKGSSYHAESPTFNLKYYDGVKVLMHTWNDFYFDDSATISISNDNGLTWNRVWYSVVDNPAFIPEWKELYFDAQADNYMSRQSNVKLRFSIDQTLNSPRAGFNIDQFIVSGNHLETDVGITQIIKPIDDCMGYGNDTVTIELRNYAEGATPNRIPVFYALWGVDSIIVRDTVVGSIPQDGSRIFKFSKLADFPRGDVYDKFTVGIELPGDEDARNDTLRKLLYIQDSHEPPVLENFEYKGGVWVPSKANSWQCMISDGSIPVLTSSPNSWLLSPYGEYPNGDTAYVASSCYDLTNANRNIVELKYWMQSEPGADGMAIEYSTNDGASWHLVDTSVYGRKWGWYTNNVSALGHRGWSGNSGGWKTVKEVLPASLSTEPKVRFRVIWMSNAANNARGAAFDDFRVFPAPADIGVSSIANPYTACENVNNSTVSLYVRNYGFNKLSTGDTIIVGLDIESEPAIINTKVLTSNLLPGDSIRIDLITSFDFASEGTYKLTAYTLSEKDPLYYQSNNDTLTKTISVWPNPTIILADTIGSRTPELVVIRPDYPDWVPGYTYLWNDGSTADTLDVNGAGYYSVTVTEPNHNCTASDTVLVLLLYFDAGADLVVAPQSTCELTDPEDWFIRVRVRNMGTDSLIAGDNIRVFYRVNNGSIVEDTITLTATLRANHTIIHEFSNDPYDFSALGTYDINTWAYYLGGDSLSSNDSARSLVSAYGYTPLNLGSDVVVQALQYTLDAGSGFNSYLWNTGATAQSIAVTTSGEYSVYADDPNGCPAYDTINVRLKIRDIRADLLASPVTSCDRNNPEEVRFRVVNNGTDTISTSEQITLWYTVNGGTAVTETVYPPYTMTPGTQYTHTFSGLVNMSDYKNYSFVLVAKTIGDLRTINDTLKVTVRTNPNPKVDFGPDKIVGATQYTMNAGAGPGHNYLWQDNQTTDSLFTAYNTGTYFCIVTNNSTGCTGGDTIKLTFDYADFSVRSVTINNKPCEDQAQRNVQVEILYDQGSAPRTVTVLPVAFQVDNNPPVIENITVSSLWLPLSSKKVALTNSIIFETSGTGRRLRIYLNNMGDLNPSNDELVRNDIDVLPSPVVDFGGDTLQVGFPYVLDPGPNFSSYQWQDNSTNRTYTAPIPGLYSVTVTNASNCPTSKSVYLEGQSFINSIAEEQIDVRIYPNPAADLINIKAELRTTSEVMIEMIDIANRIVFSDRHKGYSTYENQLSVGNLSPGVYFIRISNAEIYYISRVIIQK